MPPVRAPRRSDGAFRWIRAGAFALVTLFALRETAFYPAALDGLFALAAGTLALFSPGLAVLAFVVPVALPLMAADLLVGAVFLVLGFAAVQYLGQDDASAFLAIVLTFVGAKYGVGWAGVALAGYLLGTAEGAAAALIACLALEAAGLLLGHEAVGVVATGGGGTPTMALGGIAEPLKFAWLAENVRAVDPGRLLTAFGEARAVALLVAQPLMWAGGAALAGGLRGSDDAPRRPLRALLALTAGTGAVAAAGIALMLAFRGPVSASAMGVAASMSLAIVVVVGLAWELLFPPVPVEERAARAPRQSMSAEEADVDELLRLIASAEAELATKHTTDAVVMITDMKSFSKMTEEEGSVVTAKLIQKHRDLLLPIVAARGGNGKSTGGDGLVAAFGDPAEALSAAGEMQRALAAYNVSSSAEREMWIRIGIARGEVVLDKGGRPFIGSALNQAARVMNLADGGQIMVAEEVATAAGREGFPLYSHGHYALKNIAEPLEVLELLWTEGQEPKAPPFETVS